MSRIRLKLPLQQKQPGAAVTGKEGTEWRRCLHINPHSYSPRSLTKTSKIHIEEKTLVNKGCWNAGCRRRTPCVKINSDDLHVRADSKPGSGRNKINTMSG